MSHKKPRDVFWLLWMRKNQLGPAGVIKSKGLGGAAAEERNLQKSSSWHCPQVTLSHLTFCRPIQSFPPYSLYLFFFNF